MITVTEARANVAKYEEMLEAKRVEATQQVKAQTMEYCNNELSTMIKTESEKGSKRIIIDTIQRYNSPRECCDQVQKLGGAFSIYEKVRHLHMPFLMHYIQEHGFTVKVYEESYHTANSKASYAWEKGKQYYIEW